MDKPHIRPARSSDTAAVAALHADSWRRNYRGAYSDSFLDGDVVSDRLAVWSDRLRVARSPVSAMGTTGTFVAEVGGALVGFVHTVLDADQTWGALVDNLHVAAGCQRSGIGARLMGHGARFVAETRPQSSLYLWVLEQNAAAQKFYEALDGQRIEAAAVPPVGGVAGRLDGAPLRLRYAWSDPTVLAPLAGPTPAPRRRRRGSGPVAPPSR